MYKKYNLVLFWIDKMTKSFPDVLLMDNVRICILFSFFFFQYQSNS